MAKGGRPRGTRAPFGGYMRFSVETRPIGNEHSCRVSPSCSGVCECERKRLHESRIVSTITAGAGIVDSKVEVPKICAIDSNAPKMDDGQDVVPTRIRPCRTPCNPHIEATGVYVESCGPAIAHVIRMAPTAEAAGVEGDCCHIGVEGGGCHRHQCIGSGEQRCKIRGS